MPTHQLTFKPTNNLKKAAYEHSPSSAQSFSLQEILNRFSQNALLETEITALYQKSATTIKEALQIPFCRIWQVTSDGYRLQQIAGDVDPNTSQAVALPTFETLEAAEHPLVSVQQNLFIPAPSQSHSGVITQIPGQTRWIGCIEVHAFDTYDFELEAVHFLQTVGHILANATERHRLEALTSAQSQILEKVAAETDATEVFNHLCLLLEQQLPDAYCSVLILNSETQQLDGGAAPTLPPDYAKGVDGLLVGECAGSCGTAVYRGEPVFVNDIASDPLWAPFRDFALSHGIRACWSTPFFSKSGEVLGTFAISHRAPCQPTIYHRAVLKAAAHLASITTEAHRTQLSRRQLHKTLENQVASRTAELQTTLQNLRRTQSQLIQSEKMAGLGQMVAGVAHEINNPTTFIAGNLDYVEEYTQDLLELARLCESERASLSPQLVDKIANMELEYVVEDLPKVLASMRVGSDRITDIVLGLRNFSRLDESEQKPVDLREGLENTLMILNHRLVEQGDRPAVEIHCQYGQLPLIPCFANQLNQVFMNILTNAIDALEEHRIPTPSITIRTETKAEQIVVRIADNAGGIEPAIQNRIFEPFFTTKAVGSGTGLGLSISYQIVVERHQGRLICLSQPGQGTEFVIEIPSQR